MLIRTDDQTDYRSIWHKYLVDNHVTKLGPNIIPASDHLDRGGHQYSSAKRDEYNDFRCEKRVCTRNKS